MLVKLSGPKNPSCICFLLILVFKCKGESNALQYTNFRKLSVGDNRKSLEMYTKPSSDGEISETITNQFDYSNLPLLTTKVPKIARQAKVEKKHNKYWQRRRKRKKHQKAMVNNKKQKSNLKNDFTKSELFRNQIQDKITFPPLKKGIPGPVDIPTSHSDERKPDNSEAIIDQIAQHVSDTYSMKRALTKYKSISEQRQSDNQAAASERASEAESYTRPMVVARAIQGTPTTARPKSYSNAVTPYNHHYTFQAHPNSFSFFNLGQKSHSNQNQLLSQLHPTTYSHSTPSPSWPTLFTSPTPAVHYPRYVPLSIGSPPLPPVPTAPSVQIPLHQTQTTSTQFLPSSTTPATQRPTRPTSRIPHSQAATVSQAKKEEPNLSVISPAILTEGEEDERPVKKGRNSFASREAEFQKLALDDQQTLALNELLIQVTEMKKRTVKLELDNSFLRSQVRFWDVLGSENGKTDCDVNFIDGVTVVITDGIGCATHHVTVTLLFDKCSALHSQSHIVTNRSSTKVANLEQTVSRLSVDTGHLNKVMTSLQGIPSKGKQPGVERRVAALESQFLSNRDLITRELLQFSCPSYSRSSLGSEVCQISRRQEATDRQVASLRQLIAAGGGGGGGGGGVGGGGGGGGGVVTPGIPARTTPSPPLDDRINILQNGESKCCSISYPFLLRSLRRLLRLN